LSLQRTIIAGLAGTRLVRAWRYEEVGEKPRKALLDWLDRPVWRTVQPGHPDELNIRATAAKEWAAELFDCPHCLGAHLSIACAIALRYKRTRPIVEGLAAAMILSIIVQWMPGFDFEESFPAIRVRMMGDEEAEKKQP